MTASPHTLRRWSPAEEQTLRDQYRSHGAEHCAALVGRSVHAVAHRAAALGLVKRNRKRHRKPASPAHCELVEVDRAARSQWRALPERDLWREYVAGARRDDALRNDLLGRYSLQLASLAAQLNQRVSNRVSTAEFFQLGWLGLAAAARTYDPERGTNFWTIGSLRARGEMLDALRDQDWVPRSVRRVQGVLEAKRTRLRGELGREPTDAELEAAGAHVAALRIQRVHSLSPGGERDNLLSDSLAVACGPLSQRPSGQPDEFFREMLRGLSLQAQTAIYLYQVSGAKMSEIGSVLRVSESRVSQVLAAALATIRTRLSVDEAYGLLNCA